MTTVQIRPDTSVNRTTPAACAPGSSTIRNAVAAEWLKVCTLRSTWAFLTGGVAATALGA